MSTNNDIVITADERAVEAGQVSRAAQIDKAQAGVGYFEPQTIGDLSRQGRLYVVADGLNGAASGYVAAQYAVKKVIHSFFNSKTTDPKTRLLEAVQQANADIYTRNAENPIRRPLVTTLTAALIHNNKLFIADIGDNRVYVVWDQDIEWLNQGVPQEDNADSPVVVLPPKTEPATEESPKPVTPPPMPTGLGLQKEAAIKNYSRRLFPGDIVVLCTGGLTGHIEEKEIARAVNTHPPEQAIPRLIALAAERGYKDECAISVTRVLSGSIASRPPKPTPLPVAPQWSDFDTLVQPGASPQKTTATKPMSEPPPVARKQFSVSRPISLEPRSNRGWPMIAVGLVVLAFLCVVVPLIAWYVVPPSTLAALPFAQSIGLGSDSVDAPPEEMAPEIDPETGEQVVKIPATPTGTSTITPTPGPPTATPDGGVPTATSQTTTNTGPAIASDVVSPVTTPTPSPTLPPLPTITVPAGCENKGRFVRDATIPDGTQLAPGEQFEKTWVVQNAGTCPWGPGYTLHLIDGDAMGAANIVQVRQQVAPDDDGNISVSLNAPAKPGTYEATWQLFDLDGEAFGPDLFLEIEVVPPALAAADVSGANILYDFITNANEATWSSDGVIYNVSHLDVTENLPLPVPQGLVVAGIAQLRGNKVSQGEVLLTYPDQESGFIEGAYRIDTPLQPTDTLAAELGFPKLSILSDDGVTFEAAFTPDGSDEEITIFSTPLTYQDSPITEIQPLGDIPTGATGIITLRVLGGDSLNQDWAVWINARLVRP